MIKFLRSVFEVSLVLLISVLERLQRNPMSVLQILFAIFFWAFNAVLILIAYVGLLPFLGGELIGDALTGRLPIDFLIPFIGLVGVPTTLTVVSLQKPKTRMPSLFRIFYGIELPLLFVFCLRFFILRELTPGTMFLLGAALLGMIAFVYKLFWGKPPEAESGTTLWLQLIGHGLLLASALYFLSITAFYYIPLGVQVLMNLPQAVVGIFYAILLAPITLLIWGLLTLPLGLGWLAIGDTWRHTRAFASRYGKFLASTVLLGTLALWATLLILLQQQPQVQAFQWLDKPAATVAERQALLQKAPQIRQGLLNAYLSQYRYLGNRDDFQGIKYWYASTFKVPETVAERFQDVYKVLAAPFLYNGERGDADKATRLYAQFFDIPILRAEPGAIQAALNATFQRTTAKAGLMDINQQKVLLAQQDLKVTPRGDWADVEIHEVYQNQTTDQQEVLYYFSLPESAAITGVWLGESADLSQRFEYVVSPRGAAQQVYTNETQRRVDPALLEQVGPGNYRLRAFPVLPRGDKPMHLWLTYKVMQQQAIQQPGGWPLPQLWEQRNIFWNGSTQRTVNGQKLGHYQKAWFPQVLAAKAVPAVEHTTTLDGDRIVAKPFSGQVKLPVGKRLAVVIDTSRSMDGQRAALQQTWRWLRTQVIPKNQVSLYLTSAEGMDPQQVRELSSFDANRQTFYGTLQPKQMLAQFMKLRGEQPYDAILLVTDPGSYELATNDSFKTTLPAPLWLVHLGGLQPAYDDDTQQAIQTSGGGVATSAETALQRLTARQQLGSNLVNLLDGYAWYREPLIGTNSTTPDSAQAFTPIAARQWVQARSRDLQPNELAELDAIHTIAKQYSIVTPYSSMIVLVNDRQKQDLKNAENAKDRFNREVEDQQLPDAKGPLGEVSGVPEPDVWLLLLVGAGLLVVLYSRWAGRPGSGRTRAC